MPGRLLLDRHGYHFDGRSREVRPHVGTRQAIEQIPARLQPLQLMPYALVGTQQLLDAALLIAAQFAVEIGDERFTQFGFDRSRLTHGDYFSGVSMKVRSPRCK